MTQRSAILQKKLHELESELSDIYRIQKTTPVDQFYLDDVDHTIEFLKKLYSAEVSSQHPQNNDETGERLAALESAFRQWNASRTNLALDDDALSVCSDCTYQARELDSTVKPTEKNENVVSDSSEKSVERRGGRFWGKVVRYCGVFGGGIIFGAICVGGNYVEIFSHFFAHYDVLVHLPPT